MTEAIAQERKTSTDVVFDRLYADIVSLALPPGTKISEVEIADKYGVSRQPVRDAFGRLGSSGLLLVRPQRATEVRRFSRAGIAAARFTRLALEVEIVRLCHVAWSPERRTEIDANLAAQVAALRDADKLRFLDLDLGFHMSLCDFAGVAMVADVVRANKMQVDRLCLLSLSTGADMQHLLNDHVAIIEAMNAPSPERAMDRMRAHLHRLDATVSKAEDAYGAYFED